MLKKLLLGLIMCAFVVSPAMALDLYMGDDFYVENYFDKRTYDESFPTENKVPTQGGWKVGMFMEGAQTAKSDQIKNIIIEGEKSFVTINTPDEYNFLGQLSKEYTYWLGSKVNADDIAFVLKGTATDDTPINFFFGPDDPATFGIPCIPDVNALDVPFLKIKRMGFMKNGDIRVKIAVPPLTDGRDNHIRVRTFDADGNFVSQVKIYPPYQFEKKNGDIVLDKIRVEIPASEAGSIARAEYRAYAPHTSYPETGNFLVRAITWFKLPDVEE